MDNPLDRDADDANADAPPMLTEAEVRAMLEESERNGAAGRTVPLAEVLAELDAAAERIEARLRARGA